MSQILKINRLQEFRGDLRKLRTFAFPEEDMLEKILPVHLLPEVRQAVGLWSR